MKTFKELFEAKDVASSRVYAKPYEHSEDVPEDRKEYSKVVQKELLRLLDPIIKAYQIEVRFITPRWYQTQGGWNGVQSRVVGNLNLQIKTWQVVNSNHVTGEFFNQEDAEEVAKLYKDKEVRTISHDSIRIEQSNSFSGLNTYDLGKMAEKKGIKIDMDFIDDFSQQCFYQEGPNWEEFKKKNRGAFASEKFGFKEK
jgi:hypothetical protein